MAIARQINRLDQCSPMYNELYNKISIKQNQIYNFISFEYQFNEQNNQPNLNQIPNQFIWKIEIENPVHIYELEN